MSALFVVNKSTEFVGNTIRFDASSSTGPINIYEWDMDDGTVPIFSTSAISADYSYQNYGLRLPALTVWESSASDTYILPEGITVNPHPYISISGIPAVNSALAFTDTNGPYYFTSEETEVILTLDFGDGSPQVSGAPTDIFLHQFSAAGNYPVTLTALDVYGNTSVDTRTISILVGNSCVTKDMYISLCGPDNRRFGTCKSINLTNFLSDYLQETDVYDLVKFFEDFLNTMYSGLCGFQTVETKINTSASTLAFNTPSQNLSVDPRISILEKIKRLTDLHDPDLIDIEYIQFFAKYLGYNVEISRGEIGGFGSFETSATVCSASENEKYLRFMVANLPNWYKIKTTRDMIKVMLYSFGLVGDIVQYYTKPIAQGGYDRNFINWKPDDNDDLATIPDNWFPTPHFSVKVDIDRSIDENSDVYNILNILMASGDKIIRAIESVRPINNVFHNLTAITTEYIDLWVGAQTRFSRYIRVDPDGYADWWISATPVMVRYTIDSPVDYSSQEAAYKTAMGLHINALPVGTDVLFTPIISNISSADIPTNTIFDMVIDGTNIVAAVYSYGICISSDNGASWSLSSTGLTSTNIKCLAKMGTTLYAGTNDAGVFISTDNGATWAAHNTGLTTLVINDLYVNSTTIYAATDSGVFIKNEPGDWGDLTIFGGLTDTNILCIFYYGGYLYAGTGSGIFIRSTGAWSSINTGLTDLTILAINYWQGYIVAATYGGEVFTYNSGTWYPFPNSPSANRSLLVDEDDNLIVGGIGAYLYTNTGSHYIGAEIATHVLVEKDGILYAGCGDGVFIFDKGTSVVGAIKGYDPTFGADSSTVTMYKNDVLSTDPISMSPLQQPVFDADGTIFNYISS